MPDALKISHAPNARKQQISHHDEVIADLRECRSFLSNILDCYGGCLGNNTSTRYLRWNVEDFVEITERLADRLTREVRRHKPPSGSV